MTYQLLIFLVTLLGMVLLFFTQKISVDLTALCGLLIFVVAGLISPEEAFTGFSSSAVILMGATFFISAALKYTGVGEKLSYYLAKIASNGEARTVGIVMIVGAVCSTFMTNVAATAVLLPSVASLSRRTRISPTKLFIPLSFGVVLGGSLTLATSANMLAAEFLKSQANIKLNFLSLAPVGIFILIAGFLYVVLYGRKLLPDATKDTLAGDGKNLPDLYRLNERMFTLKIPENSVLSGKTLEYLRFGEVLGTEVLAIKRGERTLLLPGARDAIMSGDLLVTRGRLEELQTLLRFSGAKIEIFHPEKWKEKGVSIMGATVHFQKRLLSLGKTLHELDFRNRFKLLAVGIERNGRIKSMNLANEALQESDLIYVVGEWGVVQALSKQEENIEVVKRFSVVEFPHESFFLIRLPENSELSDVKVRDSRLGELAQLTVVGVFRDGAMQIAVSGDELIRSGDTLLVSGRASHVERLTQLSTLLIEQDTGQCEFESTETGVMEVVLSPRSRLIGKSIEEVHFREQYGFRVLAIRRDGEPRRSRFSRVPLEFGNALLLQGPRDRMHLFTRDPDFVVLSGAKHAVVREKKARWAIFSVIVMVVLSLLQVFPPHIAACICALFVVLSGAITMEEAYREIEWRVILLIGALIPIGSVVQKLGISHAISQFLISETPGLSLRVLVLIMAILGSVLSQILDSSIAVVLLAPIAITLAEQFHVNPTALVVAATLGSSIAFLTPFSHRAHLLIMGPGGYKPKDFFKIGLGLSIISVIVLAVFVPIVWN